jgi:large repetitive protein
VRHLKATLALAAALLFAQLYNHNAASAHGAWLGNGTFDFTPSTIALLQSNVDAGKGGFQTGDFIEFRASFPINVNGTLSGPGGYITFYVPPGTEVAGAWIINASGSPIAARPATSALTGEGTDLGWGPLGQGAFLTGANGWNPSILPSGCADTTLGISYTAANCTASMAYLYGDTGIFYSTRADTAMFAGGSRTILLTNGYLTDPSNAQPWPSVGGVGNERVHNKWDAVQTNAFGANSIIANGFSTSEETKIIANGRGSTPHNAGSPVAGPDSGLPWDRYAATGPWKRISYPGSCFGGTFANKAANGTGSVLPTSPAVTAVNSISACSVTISGTTIGDDSRLSPLTNAVRFALGGISLSETHHVMVRLKVTNASLLDVANFEGHGGDSTQGSKASNDNPWRYWIGAVATAPLSTARLAIKKTIIAVNGVPYANTDIPPDAKIRYRISYANGFAQTQTNVAISDVLPSQATGVSGYSVTSGPNILPASLSSNIIAFATIPSLPPGQGGSLEFDVTTNALAGQTLSNTGRVNSAQLPTFQAAIASVKVSVPPPLTLSKASAIFSDPVNGTTNPKAIPGALVGYNIVVGNPGHLAADNSSIMVSDATPVGLVVHLADTGLQGSGPIAFVDGSTPSLLTYRFTALDDMSDDVEFSNNGGVDWTYAPTPDANSDDSNISNVRINPKGAMAPASSFEIVLRYRIK